MKSKLNPYISFRDNARQAMEFYRSVFGGELTINTFKEFQASENPAMDNLIMHSMLEVKNGITFMAADTPEGMDFSPGANVSMSLSGDNEEELTQYFEKLSEKGMVILPLEKAPWGDTFGMLRDKFGINWMVNISGNQG